jgi:hypothetical protein
MHGQSSAVERLIRLWIMQQERAARASNRRRRVGVRPVREPGAHSVAERRRYGPAGVSR